MNCAGIVPLLWKEKKDYISGSSRPTEAIVFLKHLICFVLLSIEFSPFLNQNVKVL